MFQRVTIKLTEHSAVNRRELERQRSFEKRREISRTGTAGQIPAGVRNLPVGAWAQSPLRRRVKSRGFFRQGRRRGSHGFATGTFMGPEPKGARTSVGGKPQIRDPYVTPRQARMIMDLTGARSGLTKKRGAGHACGINSSGRLPVWPAHWPEQAGRSCGPNPSDRKRHRADTIHTKRSGRYARTDTAAPPPTCRW